MQRSFVVAVVFAAACGGSAKQPAPPPTVSNTEPPPAAPEPEPEPAPEPAPPPPPTDVMSDADFERVMNQAIVMFNAMGAAVDAGGSDCKKIAAGIGRVLDDHRAFLVEAKRWKGNPDVEKRGEEWMKAHMNEIMPPLMKVGAAGQTCGTDPDFAAVLKRVEAL